MRYKNLIRVLSFSISLLFVITTFGAENKLALAIGEFERGNFILDNEYIKIVESGEVFVYKLIPDPKKFKTSLEEKSLSESDKLNGILYKGEYRIFYKGPVSKSLENDKWEEWVDEVVDIRIEIINKKDIWSSSMMNVNSLYGENYKRISWGSRFDNFRVTWAVADDFMAQAQDSLMFGHNAIKKKLPKGIAEQYFRLANEFVKKTSPFDSAKDHWQRVEQLIWTIDKLIANTDNIINNIDKDPTVEAEIMGAGRMLLEVRNALKSR